MSTFRSFTKAYGATYFKATEIDPYRRNLQKPYVGALQNILLSDRPEETETDVYSIIRADMIDLQKEINRALPRVSSKLSRYHLEDMQSRIKKALEAKLK